MKNCFWLSLLVTLFVASCASPKAVRIIGELQGVPDSTMLLFWRGNDDGDKFQSIKTIVVCGNKFEIVLHPDSVGPLPRKFSISGMSQTDGSIDFWVDLGKTKIKGTDPNIRLWRATNGTAEQKRLNELYPLDDLAIEIATHKTKYDSVAAIIWSTPSPDSASTVVFDSLDKILDSLYQLRNLNQYNLLKVLHPLTPMELREYERLVCFGFKYGDYLKPYEEEIKAKYETLSEEQKKSVIGQTLYYTLYPPKKLVIGDTIIDGELCDTSGIKHPMSEFRGKYVLLDFWSTGCGPCMMATPELNELQELYKDSLVIVSVSIDNDKEWKATSEKSKIQYTNLSDGMGQLAGFSASFEFQSIPFYVMINPQGVITNTWKGYRENVMKERISSVLGEKKKE